MPNDKPVEKLRVLYITRKFPPSKGGMERAAYELYESLAKQANVTLIKWGGSNKLLPVVLPWLLFRAAWHLVSGRVDVIYLQDGLLASLGILLKPFRKPIAITVHGLDITHETPIYQKVIPKLIGKMDIIIYGSHATEAEVKKRVPPSTKTIRITYGVRDYLYKPDPSARKKLEKTLGLELSNKQILLTVGRLVKRKGQLWFTMEVMPGLAKRNPNVIYLIVGGGEQSQQIADAIKAESLGESVKLLGPVSSPAFEQLYNTADIFVMPNIKVAGDMEGFGLVASEAATCALPIVASGIEGIKDAIVDGKNGFLLKSKDAGGYISKITDLLSDPKKAKAFGESARRFTLEHYDWDVAARGYLQVFEELARKK